MSPINTVHEAASPAWGLLTAVAGIIAPSAWEVATGLPVNVVIMALAGTLLALRWTSFDGSRLVLLFGVVVNTGIASGVTVLLPYIPGLGWTKAAPAPVIAMIGAVILQLALPLAIPVLKEELPKWLRDFKARRNP